jgi:hypothetical protein
MVLPEDYIGQAARLLWLRRRIVVKKRKSHKQNNEIMSFYL